MAKEIKEYIQYFVREVDELSPFNKNYYGTIAWFNGEDIVVKKSPTFESKIECWKWIVKELKEMLKTRK